MPVHGLFDNSDGGAGWGFASGFSVFTHTTSASTNTETSFSIPAGTIRFSVINRDNGLIRVSDVSGFTTVYQTLFPGVVWESGNLDGTGIDVYVSSPKSSQILEIMRWF